MKEPAPLPTPVKEEDAAPGQYDEQPGTMLAAPQAQLDYPREASSRMQPDEPPGASYEATDSVTLLRKFSVHATSSRRLQGVADAALMVLALIPTAVLRLIRAAMGLLGVTEHRWRGISMVVPLTLEDRKQLELLVSNLVAGRLGRRPEAPQRGPVSPSQQLLLDTHAILAAAASTATAFGLPYDGLPEAALHAKLASYLRSIATADSICTQDCFKTMRKMGRKTVVALCSAAPNMPTPPPAPPPSRNPTAKAILSTLRASPSTARIICKPKPRAVAKAFMVACLMQQCSAHADTLIQLAARLADGSGDVVETMSIISLAPGAEYLRLLGGGTERFADQLEAMAEYGRLRPSDAKKEPEVQGMAINARVHEVGVVRYTTHPRVVRQPQQEQQRQRPNQEERKVKDVGMDQGAGKGVVGVPVTEGKAAPPVRGIPSDAISSVGTESWGNGFGGEAPRRSEGSGSEGGYVSADGVAEDTEGLLKRVRGTTSSQPDLLDLKPAPAAAAPPPFTNGHAPASSPNIDAVTVPHGVHNSRRPSAAPSFTAASGPSTSIFHYPTSALDAFKPLYACPRSGAFAVHGREPRGVGLSRLVTAYSSCHAMPQHSQLALLRGLGYTRVEELREEVELRKALCVAQALPVVVASLRIMCRSAACLQAAHRTGAFLHVQQSLLSDLHRHERGYLEDTKGALDVLADRLVVRFVAGSEKVLPLHINGSTITVSLPSDCVSADALAAAGLSRETFCGVTYGLATLLFNQGINSLQSLGFLVWHGLEPLQDTLNRHSMERLNEYAQRASRAAGPDLAALNQHYSTEGRRAPKDTDMFTLVRRACSEVGAGRAVNCKSGKDRTALELCKAFADEVVSAGLLPRAATSWLEAQFLRGLSYMTTSQNHGQPPAYAFNEMEILTLPPGWRPDWRLCGKVSS